MTEDKNVTSFRQSVSKFAFSSPTASSSIGPAMKVKRPFADVEVTAQDVERTSTTPTETQSKRKKAKRGIAHPSLYAHLHYVPDYARVGLDVLFCGINPGKKTAEDGHHYANPTNHFWKCLFSSGFTERKLNPNEDWTLPEKYNIGLTNLVDRPTAEESELTREEQQASVEPLLAKIAKWKPRFVCFVGLNIARIVFEKSKGGAKKIKWTAKPGLIPLKVTHDAGETVTWMFATPSTSGRTTHYQLDDKIEIFRNLKRLVVSDGPEEGDRQGFLDVRVHTTAVNAGIPTNADEFKHDA